MCGNCSRKERAAGTFLPGARQTGDPWRKVSEAKRKKEGEKAVGGEKR